MTVTSRMITITICLMIAAFLISGTAVWAREKEKKNEEPVNPLQAEDTLLHIRSEAEIGTDVRFISLLDSLGLKNDIQAPSKLRAFITSLPIVRSGMGTGYFYSIRRASLTWATGDCFVSGRREQVLQILLNSVKNTGFQESANRKEGAAAMTYTLEEGGLIYTLSFMKPEDLLMDGRPVSKTMLHFNVGDSNVSSPQILSRILTVFPFLKDRRIEDAVYQEMASVDVDMVSLGGASARASEWEAVFVPPEKANKKITLLAQIETMLEHLGYTRCDASSPTGTFTRKNTGSAAYLNKVAGSEKVRIRIKAEL